MQHAFDAILAELLGQISSGQLIPLSGRPSVLLAVSGGIDSMCMAELFRHSRVDVDFSVAHCNFSLRGEESDSDEALVTGWAGAAGVKLHKVRFDTEEYARGHGVSIEMAARELRYAWFAALCEEHGYDALAVAHNANDNVETMFLNLLRGTGIKGLTGMKTLSPLPVRRSGSGDAVPGREAVLIRPLLDFTRKQIEGYVFAHKIEYHDDRTNAETEYKRNKIRHLAFPVFEQVNPSFIRTLSREAGYFAQVDRIADAYYEERTEWMGGSTINISRLLADPNWEYLLYRALDTYGFPPAVIYSLSDLLKSGRTVSGKVFSSDRYIIVASAKDLIIKEKSEEENSSGKTSGLAFRRHGTLPSYAVEWPEEKDIVMTVHGPGNYRFNGVSFSVRTLPRHEVKTLKTPPGVLLFDSKAMPFPFICRKWADGDWLVPLGMKGRKKVSDLFTDLKYSLIDKAESVMLVDCSASAGCRSDEPEHHVAAVLGVRIDDSRKVVEDTEEVLEIRIL